MQEFDYSAEYIKGPENIVADALSRVVDNDATIIPMIVEETLSSSSIDITQQQASSSSAELNASELLYAYSIPQDKYDIIQRAHNALAGHSGVEETLRKLDLLEQRWYKRRQHVQHFVRQCPICQKNSYNHVTSHGAGYTLSTNRPMERINIDTIGPLPPDAFGNKYILAMIDNFSRFLMLYAIPDTTGEEAAKHILSYIATFGCPQQITSDQGTQFVNMLIAELLILIGTEHVTSIAYSHEENAIIERSHKETMRHLRALVFDRLLQDRWSLCLPLVQRIHNSKVHEATAGLSPARILFGDTVNLDINIFVPEEIGQFSSGEPKELSVYMRKLLDSQE